VKFLGLTLVVLLASGCGASSLQQAPQVAKAPAPWALEESKSRHLFLGLPTSTDPSVQITVLDREDFFVGWDNTLHAARWVAWAVAPGDLGQARRKNNFREDLALPSGFFRVGPQDYAHSGYDRGHFCPSGDRTKSPEQNGNTFVMTNMHPQRHALNAGPWEKLEEATRSALQLPDDVAYVVAGALYKKDAALLGRGVPIPSHSWKTVVWTKTSLTPEQLPANAVSTTVLMPNEDARENDSFVQYKTTIAQVESLSHLRLLTSLAPATQTALRAAGDERK
jgi:endonuclease G, mitochondrial